MKLLKKINNNYALALDTNGEEIIVSGKGIGFVKMPCTLDDLTLITRSYYGIKNEYLEILTTIPKEMTDIATEVVEYASARIISQLNSNLFFTMADHLNFCLERYQKGVAFDYAVPADFKKLYNGEYLSGLYALSLIRERMGVQLPESEAYGIALNIINSELVPQGQARREEDKRLLEHITVVIENYFHQKIDRENVNYYRFATHMQYMFDRIRDNNQSQSDNGSMFEEISVKYASARRCADFITNYLNVQMDTSINNEEKLYIILHINRLISRQEANS